MLIDICGTEFDLEHPTSIYVNCDCMMGMKQFPDKYFDLAVVDPPYGININNSMGRRKGDKQSEYPKAYWDNTPPICRIFQRVIQSIKTRYCMGRKLFLATAYKMFFDMEKTTNIRRCEFFNVRIRMD